MKDVSSTNFGILVSYVVPGVTAVWGVGYFSPAVRQWFGASPLFAPTVGGFLYATLAAVAAGVTVSTVRWMVVDRLHGWTGLRRPPFDYAKLQENLAAFDLLVRHHYEYYKFHANMLTALVFTCVARRVSVGFFTAPIGVEDLGFLLLAIVFLAGSRNTLRNYYTRVEMLLGDSRRSSKRSIVRRTWERLSSLRPPRGV